MNVRRTSFRTYCQIRDRDLLSKMRWRVYHRLYESGPLTSAELDDRMKYPGEVRPGYHKRLSELRNLGVVFEVGESRCRITSRIAIQWDVTELLPSGEPTRRTTPRPNKAQLATACKVLAHWQRCAELRGERASSEVELLMGWLNTRAAG